MSKGFTLAELLIALLILGVIAAFSIPKVLVAQESQRNRAVTKEVVSMLAAAYRRYQLENTVSATSTFVDVVQYLNYVKRDTDAFLDQVPTNGLGFIQCDNTTKHCYKLHNGAMLQFYVPAVTFTGTSSNQAWQFLIDPDGDHDGITKSVSVYMYINGRITTEGQIDSNTCNQYGCWNPDPNADPSWFYW